MRYVGISFQITDDVLNITDDLGKQRAEDFYERKFTIVIHHLRNNEEFMKLFFLREKTPEIIEKMVEIVHR
jgi:geranylgeranyl pyrophosphate synthase